MRTSALGTALIAGALLAGCRFAGVPPAQSDVQNAALLESPKTPIRHVVIIVQENRTFENLFHGFPGADTVRYGKNSFGKNVLLRPVPLVGPLDFGHSHHAFEVEYDRGKMDGFNLVHSSCAGPKQGKCPPPDVAAYSYVPTKDVRPYWQMAKTYTLADAMFASNQGPSFPAHQYLVSGTSAISNTSSFKAASNPFGDLAGGNGGCSASRRDKVSLIDRYGNENKKAWPCFDRTSLMALLTKAGLTWRYYGFTTAAGVWNAPNAVRPVWRSRVYQTSVVAPPSRLIRDLAKGELASVTWVTPERRESDHPRGNDGSGPSWVAAVVNAVGESQFWNSTAIFVTWDDWGGFYDHVTPHIFNSYELGFRVPLIVVSPYAKRGYLAHRQYEFGSLLKFTENVFNLPSLGTTDARANDLLDCFDFGGRPHAFEPIRAPLGAEFFLNRPDDRRPPDDD